MIENISGRADCQVSCRNWGRGLLLGVGAAGAALTAGSLALAYFSTHPCRIPLWTNPGRLGWDYEDVEFPSRDGTRISGWFIPAEDARAGIILCHGFPMNRAEMLGWAPALRQLGVHLLLFDFRALGRSGGDLCTIGHHETLDMLGAADYLEDRPEMSGLPMGAFGLSMGGAVAIMASAQDQRIAAVATHGAYATLEDAMVRRCRLYAGPFGPALYTPTRWWGRRWMPIDPGEVSPLDVIGRIAPRPVLMFHGMRDKVVSPQDAERLYDAAGAPKILHRMARSWHFRIHTTDREEYDRILLGFFSSFLTERDRSSGISEAIPA